MLGAECGWTLERFEISLERILTFTIKLTWRVGMPDTARHRTSYNPIPLPNGGELQCLRDSRHYIAPLRNGLCPN